VNNEKAIKGILHTFLINCSSKLHLFINHINCTFAKRYNFCLRMNKDLDLKKVESYLVPEMDAVVRLSDFYKPDMFKTINSRVAMKKAIKKGLIKIDGDIGFTGDHLKGGECIEIYQAIEQKIKPYISIKLEVIYEDDDLAVVNKPCGIVVSGNKRWTLENALSGNLKQSMKPDALLRPQPVHRLDYPTSGVLLIAKTSQAVLFLNKLFEERKIVKIYHAITIGSLSKSGLINSAIENKEAETEFKVLRSIESSKYDFLNLTELKPHTGRRHQLRIHMSENGNPIFGDLKYGVDGLILKGKGLYLHASSLSFIHPFTKKAMLIQAAMPQKFTKLFPEFKTAIKKGLSEKV
jgi:23S rRNA pseudouridine1911/1915/1917 synthase